MNGVEVDVRAILRRVRAVWEVDFSLHQQVSEEWHELEEPNIGNETI